MNEVELTQWTKQFALRVMKLVGALPEDFSGTADWQPADSQLHGNRRELSSRLSRSIQGRIRREARCCRRGSRRKRLLAGIDRRKANCWQNVWSNRF